MKDACIAGCGYIGEKIARSVITSGAVASCMVRSVDHAARLEAEGFATLTCSMDEPESIHLPDLSGRVVYYLIPPPGGGTTDTRARNFIAAVEAGPPPEKIVYMSATSVYSETGGGVVTEESPTEPSSAMGKRRLDAERAFLAYGSASGTPVVILRVSGIYGPGRLPIMQISQGQPLLREDESGPSNRIHADDLAAICLAAAEKGKHADIFNVSDGHPSSMTSYFNACADLLGYPRQPQVTLDEARRVMSPLMLSYVTESRIVDNSRMLRNLGVELRFQTFLQGISASIQQAANMPS